MRKISRLPEQCYAETKYVFIWPTPLDPAAPWFNQPGPLERMCAPYGAHEFLMLPRAPLQVLTDGIVPLP